MIAEETYQNYLAHLLAGDRADCTRIVEQLRADSTPIKELYLHLLQRAMYEVGRQWETHQISVAVEHLATSITETLLSLIYPDVFAVDRVGKSAVVACVANEYHQLGGKMVADFFELHGWDCAFLGGNTPIEDLVEMLQERTPDLLGLSVSLAPQRAIAKEVLRRVRAIRADQRILLGGQAFAPDGGEELNEDPHVMYVPSLDELERIIQAESSQG